MKYLTACICVLLSLYSCELLLQAPLTITGYSPDSSTLASPDNLEIWVRFSTSEVDKTSVEQAFSFSEGSAPMEGSYSWNGDRMTFIPLQGLSMGKSYTLRVSSSAEDSYGNNLKGEFSFTFHIGSDTERPTVISVIPLDDSEIVDQFNVIEITFSELVDHASFYDAFSLSPHINGSYEWDETTIPNVSICTFTPHEAYAWQTDYTITVSEELKDLADNHLGHTFTSRFSLGTDHDPPTFTVFYDDGGAGIELLPNTNITDWEAAWPITIDFNGEQVLELDSSYFQFTPSLSYTVDWDYTNQDSVVLTPTDRFEWGTMYTLVVKKGITDLQGNATTDNTLYQFTVDGMATRPPQVIKVYAKDYTVPADPFVLLNMWDSIFDDPEFADITLTDYIFDFYIEHADGATIPETFFIENLDIDTYNECVTINIQNIEEVDPGDTNPLDPPTADEIVMRVHCEIIFDAAPPAGMIELIIKSGLTDSEGNPIAEAYSLMLNKP